MLQTLRRAGGSLVMTVPKAFIEQNQLQDGSQVEFKLEGARMTIEAPRRQRYKLEELMAEMSKGMPCVHGWDEMPAVSKEACCWPMCPTGATSLHLQIDPCLRSKDEGAAFRLCRQRPSLQTTRVWR